MKKIIKMLILIIIIIIFIEIFYDYNNCTIIENRNMDTSEDIKSNYTKSELEEDRIGNIIKSSNNKDNNKIKSEKHIEINVELTGYCNDYECSGNWGNRTAMQTYNRIGVIAAPKNIKLGTKIYIPTLKNYKKDGIFTVEDRGGAVVQKSDGTYIIDIWFSAHEQTIKFGRKKTKAYIII